MSWQLAQPLGASPLTVMPRPGSGEGSAAHGGLQAHNSLDLYSDVQDAAGGLPAHWSPACLTPTASSCLVRPLCTNLARWCAVQQLQSASCPAGRVAPALCRCKSDSVTTALARDAPARSAVAQGGLA